MALEGGAGCREAAGGGVGEIGDQGDGFWGERRYGEPAGGGAEFCGYLVGAGSFAGPLMWRELGRWTAGSGSCRAGEPLESWQAVERRRLVRSVEFGSKNSGMKGIFLWGSAGLAGGWVKDGGCGIWGLDSGENGLGDQSCWVYWWAVGLMVSWAVEVRLRRLLG